MFAVSFSESLGCFSSSVFGSVVVDFGRLCCLYFWMFLEVRLDCFFQFE